MIDVKLSNKKTIPILNRYGFGVRFPLHKHFYSRPLSGVWSMNLVKSWILAPVDDKILEILFVDGQRGWPSLDQRLLLLKVVGSRPLHFARPEQDIPCSVANFSMARQTSSCVIFFSLLVSKTLVLFFLMHIDFIPEYRLKTTSTIS